MHEQEQERSYIVANYAKALHTYRLDNYTFTLLFSYRDSQLAM